MIGANLFGRLNDAFHRHPVNTGGVRHASESEEAKISGYGADPGGILLPFKSPSSV